MHLDCRKAHLPKSTPLVGAVLCLLLLAACGSGGDWAPVVATAQQVCTALSGNTIAGATVAAVAVAASDAAPTYCKVTGALAPTLNFEMRLPDAWNRKLYYGGGGGSDGSVRGLAGADGTGNNLKALQMGYATGNSDSGHSGSPMSASFDSTEPYAANVFRSFSVPTVASSAKELLQAQPGRPATPTKSRRRANHQALSLLPR